MRTRLILLAFAVVAIGQVAVPIGMIRQREQTLQCGRAYKFKTAPIDPSDPFRGRYVWLNFEQHCAPWEGDKNFPPGRPAYAWVEVGPDGYAVVHKVTPAPPVTGDFVKVMAVYPGWGTNAGNVQFTLPFNRFYLEESKAPAAERAYWKHSNRRGPTYQNTYALVRVRGDDAALEELYIAGKPIREFLRETKP